MMSVLGVFIAHVIFLFIAFFSLKVTERYLSGRHIGIFLILESAVIITALLKLSLIILEKL